MKILKTLALVSCLSGCMVGTTYAQLSNAELEVLWADPAKNADRLVAEMSMREKIGQVLMLDIRNWGGTVEEPLNVTILPAELSQAITEYRIGSLALFRENLINTEQTYQLITDVQRASYQLPLIIGVDQEGGYVTRLREGTEMPGNMALAATRNKAMAQQAGTVHGAELKALGFHLNFSPVLDVNINQNNPVIGVRSYSSDIPLVNEMAAAYISGLHSQGIMATAKHFPGHGNVATDSHIGLPVVPYSEQEWRQNDLIPFQQAIGQNIDAIMTGHIVMPALDDTKVISIKDGAEIGLPATLSKKILTGILRGELQYKGLILSDAMDMGAIVENFGVNQAVERALLAGVDIAVMPIHIWDQQGLEQLSALYAYLEQQSAVDPELSARITESARNVVKYKLSNHITASNKATLAQAKAIVASEAHKKAEQQIAEKSITLIENQNVLPYQLSSGNNQILVISDEMARNKLIQQELARISDQLPKGKIVSQSLAFNLTNGELPPETDERIQNSDFIILVTYNLNKKDSSAQKIIDSANRLNKPLVVISSRNPYDIAHLDRVNANIAIYGITGFDITNNNRNSLEANIKAGIRSLFKNEAGQTLFNIPDGKLPVDIADENSEIIYSFGRGLTY